MAYRVELSKEALIQALESAAASIRRGTNKDGINPKIKALLEQDLKDYRKAIDTLTEVK